MSIFSFRLRLGALPPFLPYQPDPRSPVKEQEAFPLLSEKVFHKNIFHITCSTTEPLESKAIKTLDTLELQEIFTLTADHCSKRWPIPPN